MKYVHLIRHCPAIIHVFIILFIVILGAPKFAEQLISMLLSSQQKYQVKMFLKNQSSFL
jgi:hypothetical protein